MHKRTTRGRPTRATTSRSARTKSPTQCARMPARRARPYHLQSPGRHRHRHQGDAPQAAEQPVTAHGARDRHVGAIGVAPTWRPFPYRGSPAVDRMRSVIRPRRGVLALSLAATLGGLTGCAGPVGHAANATSTASPLTSADSASPSASNPLAASQGPPTPPTAATRSPARVRCAAGQLTLVEDPALVSEKTGQHTALFDLTNHGANACFLDGYPGVSLLDASGRGPSPPVGVARRPDGDPRQAPSRRPESRRDRLLRRQPVPLRHHRPGPCHGHSRLPTRQHRQPHQPAAARRLDTELLRTRRPRIGPGRLANRRHSYEHSVTGHRPSRCLSSADGSCDRWVPDRAGPAHSRWRSGGACETHCGWRQSA